MPSPISTPSPTASPPPAETATPTPTATPTLTATPIPTATVTVTPHLLVQEVSFNCFWDMPTWLNEGLASYSEGPLAGFLAEELDLAIRSRGLISVRSLSSNFPADRTHALRSYAQSNSIVTYLIEEHGWQKMRELLALFGEGSTADDALRRVYGLDTEELDGLWKEYVGAR